MKMKFTSTERAVTAASMSLRVLGRGSINVGIRDSEDKNYQHGGSGRHFGVGAWIPISPQASPTHFTALRPKNLWHGATDM